MFTLKKNNLNDVKIKLYYNSVCFKRDQQLIDFKQFVQYLLYYYNTLFLLIVIKIFVCKLTKFQFEILFLIIRYTLYLKI